MHGLALFIRISRLKVRSSLAHPEKSSVRLCPPMFGARADIDDVSLSLTYKAGF
jgi:hypothetical protein